MKKLSLTGPALTGTQGIFAQKRKGKSYTAQTQAEDFLEKARQIGVVDPTGAWWGLRSSADGESALEQLDDSQRRIVESTGTSGEFKTITDLATKLGVHPHSSSFLGDIGKLRERGLVSKGWPLRLTDVFVGGPQ